MKGNLYTVFFAAMLGIVCASLLTFVAISTKDAREANEKSEKYRNVFKALDIAFDKKATGEQLAEIFSKSIQEKSSFTDLGELFAKTMKENETPEERLAAFEEEVASQVFKDPILEVFGKVNEQHAEIKGLKLLLKIKGIKLIFEEELASIGDVKSTLTLYRNVDDEGNLLGVALGVKGPGLWGAIEGVLALEPDMKTIKGLTFYKQEETPGLGGEIASDAFLTQFIGKSIYDASGNAGIEVITGKPAGGINQVDGISGATMTCDKVQDLLNTSILEIAEAK